MNWIRAIRSDGRVEWQCEHGVGHGDGVHGCDGCCQRDDYPMRDRAEIKKRIASIRKRLDDTSPRPWTYNSYDDISSDPLLHKLVAEHDEDYKPTYDETDLVCTVPAESGTMATGRHSNDAHFIAHAPSDIEWLLARLDLAGKLAEAVQTYINAEAGGESATTCAEMIAALIAYQGEGDDE